MCDICEWEDTLEELNALCGDSNFEWANDTLSGIAEWVEEHRHVTKKQIGRIAAIKGMVQIR